jgi:hybrid cluster-associated redox disulfide protein
VEQPSRPKQTRQPSRPRQHSGLNQHSDHTSASIAIAGQTVADVLACWPQTAPVFMRYRLACVGCSLARFEIITDVAAIYGINPAGFLHELQQAIEGGKSGKSGDRDSGNRMDEIEGRFA